MDAESTGGGLLMIVSRDDIPTLAARLVQVSGALGEIEPLIKGTRAKAREELQAELEPYTTRQAELQAERAELVATLLPEWVQMYETRKVKRLMGIELRRGKTYKAALPPEDSPEYRALALSLLEELVNGEPIVSLKIDKRALDKWVAFHGLQAAADLGIEVAASDTLAVYKDD